MRLWRLVIVAAAAWAWAGGAEGRTLYDGSASPLGGAHDDDSLLSAASAKRRIRAPRPSAWEGALLGAEEGAGAMVATAVGDAVMSIVDPRHLERAHGGARRKGEAGGGPAVGFVRQSVYNVTVGQTLQVEVRCDGCATLEEGESVSVDVQGAAADGDTAVEGTDYLLAQVTLRWDAGSPAVQTMPLTLLPHSSSTYRRLSLQLFALNGANLEGVQRLGVLLQPGLFCENGGVFVNATSAALGAWARVCYCPADWRGTRCSVPVPPRCEPRLTNRDVVECGPDHPPSAALARRLRYDWRMDGAPPCVSVPGDGELALTFEVACRTPDGAGEGPDTEAQPWLLDDGYEWPLPDLDGAYQVLLPDLPLRVSRAADAPRLRLKFVNGNSLWHDNRHAVEADVPLSVLAGNDDLLVTVPVTPMEEADFYPGGRLLSEFRVLGASSAVGRQHFEVSTFSEPPHRPAGLSGVQIFFIALAVVVALAAGPVGCFLSRRRKLRKLEARAAAERMAAVRERQAQIRRRQEEEERADALAGRDAREDEWGEDRVEL